MRAVTKLAILFYGCTDISVQIEFDPVKDAVNLAKHSVSLRAVERFEWDSAPGARMTALTKARFATWPSV